MMCPKAHRENFFAEFENRMLHPGENPVVFKWELGEILQKADPSLSEVVHTSPTIQICANKWNIGEVKKVKFLGILPEGSKERREIYGIYRE